MTAPRRCSNKHDAYSANIILKVLPRAMVLLMAVLLVGCRTDPRLSRGVSNTDPIPRESARPGDRITLRVQAESGRPLPGTMVEFSEPGTENPAMAMVADAAGHFAWSTKRVRCAKRTQALTYVRDEDSGFAASSQEQHRPMIHPDDLPPSRLDIRTTRRESPRRLRQRDDARPPFPHAPTPLWTIVLLGTWVAAATTWIDSDPVRGSLLALVLLVTSFWAGLRVARRHRWFVGLGTLFSLLTVVLPTAYASLLLPDSLRPWWSLILAPLISTGMVYGYRHLSYWCLPPIPSGDAPLPPRPRRSRVRRAALMVPVLIQFAVLALGWGYVEQPCTAIDLTRRLDGCRQLHIFPDHTDTTYLSPDGTRAVSVQHWVVEQPFPSSDPTTRSTTAARVSVWDLTTGRLLHTIEQPSRVWNVALSTDGQLLATSDTDQIQVWRMRDRQLLYRLPGTFLRDPLRFSPDGTILAITPDSDDGIQLWSMREGTLLRTITTDGHVQDLQFAPNGEVLALRELDGRVTLWRVQDGALQQTLETGGNNPVLDPTLAFSPDGQLLAASSTLITNHEPIDPRTGVQVARVWRLRDGVLLHTLYDVQQVIDRPNGMWLTTVAFSADGTRLITGITPVAHPHGTRYDAALVWRVHDGTLLARMDRLPSVNQLRVPANDTQLLVASVRQVYTQHMGEGFRD